MHTLIKNVLLSKVFVIKYEIIDSCIKPIVTVGLIVFSYSLDYDHVIKSWMLFVLHTHFQSLSACQFIRYRKLITVVFFYFNISADLYDQSFSHDVCSLNLSIIILFWPFIFTFRAKVMDLRAHLSLFGPSSIWIMSVLHVEFSRWELFFFPSFKLWM